MKDLPLVSVLIPSYNYANYICEAIESVLAQTYTNFQLLIVDNCSTDNTEEVIQKYLSHSRVSFHKNSSNLGLTGNFNQCIKLSNGKYIKLLMADDKFHPELLMKFVDVMETHPQVVLVTSYSEIFGIKSEVRKAPFTGLQDGKKIIVESLREGQPANWIGEPTTTMFRREAIDKSGYFDTNFFYLVDWEMWTRILLTGDCCIIPEVLSYFRVHTDQISEKTIEYYACTFEDYLLYKQTKTNSAHLLNLSSINIDSQLKRKATYCGDVMYKLLPMLYKKKSWRVFAESFRIANKEKVLGRSFLKVLKAFKKSLNL